MFRCKTSKESKKKKKKICLRIDISEITCDGGNNELLATFLIYYKRKTRKMTLNARRRCYLLALYEICSKGKMEGKKRKSVE